MNDSGSYLEAAARIGAGLRRDAWWHEGRCNWIGHAPEEALPGHPPTVTALGPDLYGGTAGVSLFLAELAHLTGDGSLTSTVEGALAHACSRLESIPTVQRIGLYSGWMGIAYVLVRAGLLLDRGDWVECGHSLALRTVQDRSVDCPLDVVGGIGGAALGLLAIERMAAGPGLAEGALVLAEGLVAQGRRDGQTLSWDPERASGSSGMGRVPSTGFAHGASGMALALLEVGVRMSRSDLRASAEAAFEYERQWFDPKRENWPDLRSYEPNSPRDSQTLAYGNAWCHGAPGIGLARSRALAFLPDNEGLRGDARAATRTARKLLDGYGGGARSDLTPCHGLAGLTELLLAGDGFLGSSARAEVDAVWSLLVARHRDADDWPTGLPSTKPVPSLMLGTAGVGHTLLRLAAPTRAPSVLLIGVT